MIKLTSLLEQILVEGGNVFGTSAAIKKEFIEPTLTKFVETLSSIFPNKAASFKTFETLGSVGKKDVSGDIDLAYDITNFINDGKPDLAGWGLDATKYQQMYDLSLKRARTATPAQVMLRTMLEMIAIKANESNFEINSSPKSAAKGSLFFDIQQYDENKKVQPITVQVDINVGDPKWLRFSYYSNVYKGNIKGLHRTQLLLSLLNNKGKMFQHGYGIIDKETREVEAKTPEETYNLINKLYNTNITADIVDDYFKLIDFITKNVSKDDLNNILDTYIKILDQTRADIPENLQQYWIKNQERLGLKGKYLPDTSNLYNLRKV